MRKPYLFAMCGLSVLTASAPPPPCYTGRSISIPLDQSKPQVFKAEYLDPGVYKAYRVALSQVTTDQIVFEGGQTIVTPQMLKTWAPSFRHKRAELRLAGVLFGECRGQDISCAYAAGHVVMNRAALNADKLYGEGIWGVLNKHAAFSCLLHSDPNYKKIQLAMAGKLNPHSPDGIKWTMMLGVSHDLMHHKLKDPTKGSVLYYAASMKKPPKWASGKCVRKEATIAGHIYFHQYSTKVVHTGFLHLGKKKIVCDYPNQTA